MTSGMDCAETWSAQVGEVSKFENIFFFLNKAQIKVLSGHMVD